MTVHAFEPPSRRSAVLTPADVHKLLVKAGTYDGRRPGEADTASWHEAAVMQRWTSLPLAMDAVRDYYSRPAKQGERLWLMPGHVTEYVRAQGRQPEPIAEQQERAQIESAPPASAERRAALMAAVNAMSRRKSIPEPSLNELVDEAAAAKAAAEESRRAMWSAVDACAGCDQAGMRLDRPTVVCDHSAAVSTGKSGRDENRSPVLDHEVAS